MENDCTCFNCKYFKRYYVVGNNCKFIPVYDGICANIKVKSKTKYSKKNLGCDLWQPCELQKLKLQYGIEQRLQTISENIEQFLEVLRDME